MPATLLNMLPQDVSAAHNNTAAAPAINFFVFTKTPFMGFTHARLWQPLCLCRKNKIIAAKRRRRL
jgi:hypothetical protein